VLAYELDELLELLVAYGLLDAYGLVAYGLLVSAYGLPGAERSLLSVTSSQAVAAFHSPGLGSSETEVLESVASHGSWYRWKESRATDRLVCI
jgi:hypothetical protein